MLHYLSIHFDCELINKSNESIWLIEQIKSATNWNAISPKLDKLLHLDKNNYFDLPILENLNHCEQCNTQTLCVLKENNLYSTICWLCLEKHEVLVCPYCNTAVVNSEVVSLDENDKSNIICNCCYENKIY